MSPSTRPSPAARRRQKTEVRKLKRRRLVRCSFHFTLVSCCVPNFIFIRADGQRSHRQLLQCCCRRRQRCHRRRRSVGSRPGTPQEEAVQGVDAAGESAADTTCRGEFRNEPSGDRRALHDSEEQCVPDIAAEERVPDGVRVRGIRGLKEEEVEVDGHGAGYVLPG